MIYIYISGTIIPFGYDAPIQYERELKVCHKRQHYVDWYPQRPHHLNRKTIATTGSTSSHPLTATSTTTSSSNSGNNNTDTLKVILFLPGLGLSSKNVCNSYLLLFIHYIF